jgi:hypothetical protein
MEYEPLQIMPAPAGLRVVYSHRKEDGSVTHDTEPALALAVVRVTKVVRDERRKETKTRLPNQVHALIEAEFGIAASVCDERNFVGLLPADADLAQRYPDRPAEPKEK